MSRWRSDSYIAASPRHLVEEPNDKSFTVEKILNEIGTTSFGASLTLFAMVEVVPIPIPFMSSITVLPTTVLAAQMTAGRQQVRLPKFVLKRTVPRKALAAAINTVLPALKKAEKVTKPRLQWVTTPTAQRFLGLYIFLLAASIALPLPGFNMLQAVGIFIIGLGLVEKDGLMIWAGAIVGLLGVILLGAVLFGLVSLLGF